MTATMAAHLQNGFGLCDHPLGRKSR